VRCIQGLVFSPSTKGEGFRLYTGLSLCGRPRNGESADSLMLFQCKRSVGLASIVIFQCKKSAGLASLALCLIDREREARFKILKRKDDKLKVKNGQIWV